MNNPLANFDLSLFLENLPNTLQRPMTVAVGASILTHGLVLVGLPLLTGAADAPEKPDRVVNVITLTPEEQAKLPQAAPAPMPGMMGIPGMGLLPGIGALPGVGPLLNGSSTLPSTGSTPMPILPSLNPSNNPLLGFDFPNSYTTPTDSYNYNPFPQVSQPVIKDEKKEEKKTDDKKTDDKKTDDKKTDDKKTDDRKTDDKKTDDKKTELPDLTPGVPGTTGPIAAANPNGAAPLTGTQPATQLPLTPEQLAALRDKDKNIAIAKQKEDLRIATTFNLAMTTPEAARSESNNFISQTFIKLADSGVTDEQFKTEERFKALKNPITMVETALPITPTSFDFSQAKVTIVTVVIGPNNELLLPPKGIGSGYKYLDELAEKAVGNLLEAERKKAKPSGNYQAIKFPIKFVIPPAPAPVS
jgi:hypothetical protein